MATINDTPSTQFTRYSPLTTPRLAGGESPALIALTTSYGLYAVKVTQYDAYDEDSTPHWSTACSSGFTIDPSQILWWAYADDLLTLVESCSQMSTGVAGAAQAGR